MKFRQSSETELQARFAHLIDLQQNPWQLGHSAELNDGRRLWTIRERTRRPEQPANGNVQFVEILSVLMISSP